MSVTTTYNVELRDKSGNLKTYLTPFVSKVTWEWNRIGGCGRCSITLKKQYRSISFGPHDDIQIRIESGATSKLVYRGFIEGIVPTLKIDQDIVLDVKGYFDLLKKRVIHDTGDKKIYTNSEISGVVTSIIDTFVTSSTVITKGTIDIGTFVIDTISFKSTVDDALMTLAELAGDVEYGVDEDLVFFWRTENASLVNRFFVGNNIETMERRINWEQLLNRIVFQGADVSGVPFTLVLEASDSQTQYFLAESIIMNSAITTDTVANQYLSALLRENASPTFNIRARIRNTDLRIEDTIPLGEVSFYDSNYDQEMYKWGKTASGGSNLIWGKIVNNGSDGIWGGAYKAQINRISYSMSDTDAHFNIEIQLGDTILETAAKIKRIEHDLSNLRER